MMQTQTRSFGARVSLTVGFIFLMVLSTGLLALATVPNFTLGQQIAGGAFFLLVYAALGWFVARWLTHDGMPWPRFDVKKIPWLIQMWLGMLIFSITMTTFIGMTTGVQSSENQDLINEMLKELNPGMVTMVLYGAFLAPIVEELIFRGVVMNYFLTKSHWWANIILSGVLFAIPHMGVLSSVADVMNFSLYAGMGMILGYIYKKTSNLKYSIAVHMMNNAISMLPVLGYLIWQALS